MFGALFGRPDGFGSSDFVRIEIFLCSIDLYGFGGPDFLKIMDFLTEEGLQFEDFFIKTQCSA